MIHELPVSQAYRKITVMMRSIYTLLLSMPLYKPYREHFAKHKDTLRYQIYGTPTGDPRTFCNPILTIPSIFNNVSV